LKCLTASQEGLFFYGHPIFYCSDKTIKKYRTKQKRGKLMRITKMKPITSKNRKYLSYREAFSRINKAIDSHFFLEAITIEESILCDRIISYLYYKYNTIFSEKDLKSNKTLLYSLLNLWRKNQPETISYKDYNDLRKEIDEWRNQRNKLIHSMTKSSPGKPTINIRDFMEDACITAIKGKKLARALCETAKRGKIKISH
jgi:hypothetical protein